MRVLNSHILGSVLILSFFAGCSDNSDGSEFTLSDDVEASDAVVDGRNNGDSGDIGGDAAIDGGSEDGSDTENDAEEQKNCPAVADSCDADCYEIMGAKYDADRKCLEQPRVIGCTSDNISSPAATCVHQKGSDEYFYVPSVSQVWGTSWVECDEDTYQTVAANPQFCE